MFPVVTLSDDTIAINYLNLRLRIITDSYSAIKSNVEIQRAQKAPSVPSSAKHLSKKGVERLKKLNNEKAIVSDADIRKNYTDEHAPRLAKLIDREVSNFIELNVPPEARSLPMSPLKKVNQFLYGFIPLVASETARFYIQAYCTYYFFRTEEQAAIRLVITDALQKTIRTDGLKKHLNEILPDILFTCSEELVENKVHEIVQDLLEIMVEAGGESRNLSDAEKWAVEIKFGVKTLALLDIELKACIAAAEKISIQKDQLLKRPWLMIAGAESFGKLIEIWTEIILEKPKLLINLDKFQAHFSKALEKILAPKERVTHKTYLDIFFLDEAVCGVWLLLRDPNKKTKEGFAQTVDIFLKNNKDALAGFVGLYAEQREIWTKMYVEVTNRSLSQLTHEGKIDPDLFKDSIENMASKYVQAIAVDHKASEAAGKLMAEENTSKFQHWLENLTTDNLPPSAEEASEKKKQLLSYTGQYLENIRETRALADHARGRKKEKIPNSPFVFEVILLRSKLYAAQRSIHRLKERTKKLEIDCQPFLDVLKLGNSEMSASIDGQKITEEICQRYQTKWVALEIGYEELYGRIMSTLALKKREVKEAAARRKAEQELFEAIKTKLSHIPLVEGYGRGDFLQNETDWGMWQTCREVLHNKILVNQNRNNLIAGLRRSLAPNEAFALYVTKSSRTPDAWFCISVHRWVLKENVQGSNLRPGYVNVKSWRDMQRLVGSIGSYYVLHIPWPKS
jgi:hypothetical protein